MVSGTPPSPLTQSKIIKWCNTHQTDLLVEQRSGRPQVRPVMVQLCHVTVLHASFVLGITYVFDAQQHAEETVFTTSVQRLPELAMFQHTARFSGRVARENFEQWIQLSSSQCNSLRSGICDHGAATSLHEKACCRHDARSGAPIYIELFDEHGQL